MTQLMGICEERRFPQPLAKPCWVSHFSHRLGGGDHSQRSIFQRRRSTLESPVSCPKDGEYLIHTFGAMEQMTFFLLGEFVLTEQEALQM